MLLKMAGEARVLSVNTRFRAKVKVGVSSHDDDNNHDRLWGADRNVLLLSLPDLELIGPAETNGGVTAVWLCDCCSLRLCIAVTVLRGGGTYERCVHVISENRSAQRWRVAVGNVYHRGRNRPIRIHFEGGLFSECLFF